MLNRRSAFVILLLSLMLTPSLIGLKTAHASTYTCQKTNTSRPHCYGIVHWAGGTGGGYTYIQSVGNLSAGVDATANQPRLNAEMWAYGSLPTTDPGAGYSWGCWNLGSLGSCIVEVGYKSGYFQCPNSMCYFLSYVTPCTFKIVNGFTQSGGNQPCPSVLSQGYYVLSTYNTVKLGDVLPADRGKALALTVSNDGFEATYTVESYSNLYINTVPTSANMIGFSSIDVGVGLAGTSGASMPWQDFIHNQWRGGANWNYQTNSGDNGSGSASVRGPLNASFWIAPANGSNPPGGDWWVYCDVNTGAC